MAVNLNMRMFAAGIGASSAVLSPTHPPPSPSPAAVPPPQPEQFGWGVRDDDSLFGDLEQEEDAPAVDVKKRSHRTNHLGLPKDGQGRSKVRYFRSYTILYDKGKEYDDKGEGRLQLMGELGKTASLNLEGVKTLADAFVSMCPPGRSLVTASQFTHVMKKHNVCDRVMQKRLFAKLPGCNSKLNHVEGESLDGWLFGRHGGSLRTKMASQP